MAARPHDHGSCREGPGRGFAPQRLPDQRVFIDLDFEADRVAARGSPDCARQTRRRVPALAGEEQDGRGLEPGQRADDRGDLPQEFLDALPPGGDAAEEGPETPNRDAVLIPHRRRVAPHDSRARLGRPSPGDVAHEIQLIFAGQFGIGIGCFERSFEGPDIAEAGARDGADGIGIRPDHVLGGESE